MRILLVGKQLTCGCLKTISENNSNKFTPELGLFGALKLAKATLAKAMLLLTLAYSS